MESSSSRRSAACPPPPYPAPHTCRCLPMLCLMPPPPCCRRVSHYAVAEGQDVPPLECDAGELPVHPCCPPDLAPCSVGVLPGISCRQCCLSGPCAHPALRCCLECCLECLPGTAACAGSMAVSPALPFPALLRAASAQTSTSGPLTLCCLALVRLRAQSAGWRGAASSWPMLSACRTRPTMPATLTHTGAWPACQNNWSNCTHLY